jgi:hypothetical protein
MRRLAAVALSSVLVVALIARAQDDGKKPTEDAPYATNVLRLRIEGRWTLESALTQRLGGEPIEALVGEPEKREDPVTSVELKIDHPKFRDLLMKKIPGSKSIETAYLSGGMAFAHKSGKVRRCAFVIHDYDGNASLLAFDIENKLEMTGPYNVSLVMGRAGAPFKDDLLFLNHCAFERAGR